MDENRNPFDFEQSNSNSAGAKIQRFSYRSVNGMSSTGAHDQSENAYFQSGKGYTNPEQNQQKEVLIFRRINGTLLIRESFQNRDPSGQQVPYNSYEQQYPYGTGHPNSWNQNYNDDSFPNWNGQYWQNGEDSNLLLPDGLRRNQKRR